MKVKNLSIEEVRLYFFLYTFLALVAVLWVGFVATSMMYPPREYAAAPTPASLEVPTPTHVPVKAGTPLLAFNAARLCGVPFTLYWRLIQRESGGDIHAVSSAGALGAAQIKPSTLRGVSPYLRHWVPWDRLVGAACYLRQMYDREDASKGERARWHAALLSYRYGPNRKVTPSTKYADWILEGVPHD